MDLTIYDIILGPVLTDKAYQMSNKHKFVALRVHLHANKPQIKQAVEKLFGVTVQDVRVLVRKGKNKRVGKREIVGPKIKKAIIKLAPGSALNIFEQVGVANTSDTPSAT